jgi:hypothetical protein
MEGRRDEALGRLRLVDRPVAAHLGAAGLRLAGLGGLRGGAEGLARRFRVLETAPVGPALALVVRLANLRMNQAAALGGAILDAQILRAEIV